MTSGPRSPSESGETSLAHEQAEAFASERTDAYRIWTDHDGWIERLGNVVVCNSKTARFSELTSLAEAFGAQQAIEWTAILGRHLVHQPREENRPEILKGDDPGEFLVTEGGLAYLVHPSAGYSSGLFIDQRENRRFLRTLRPARVLNLFSYTCAFTVAAVAAGASETVSIDIARKALERGLRNLDANRFTRSGHRVIADDVLKVLPRLRRRGEAFDTIILDPPTFARRGKGAPFRVEEQLPTLIDDCSRLLAPGGWLFVSTNSGSVAPSELHDWATDIAPLAESKMLPPPPDFPRSALPTTSWYRWS